MVEHLKSTHLHMTPPRFHKGNYLKVKEKQSPIRPTFQQSVSPLSYISSNIFSYFVYTVHMQAEQYHSHDITLHLDSAEHVLSPFASVSLSNAMAINCGGSVVSSAFQSVDDHLFIAIGCADNSPSSVPPSSSPDGSTVSTVSTISAGLSGLNLPYPRRSFHSLRSEVPPGVGWLSIYETCNHQIVHRLHITLPHSIPIQLCWLPSFSTPAQFVGVLAVLSLEGDLDVFPIPRSLRSDLWIDVQPVVHIHFTRRITAFCVHPMYGEVLLAGLEDGSLRSVELRAENNQFQWVFPMLHSSKERSEFLGASARLVRIPPNRLDFWNSTKRFGSGRLRHCRPSRDR